MRGSVEYQTAQLVYAIFREGTKKSERMDPQSEHYGKVASYNTMASYRQIWNNFFHYLKEHWQIKNAEHIEGVHVAAYMDYKVEYYPSKQYLEKMSAALGKLETALLYYTKNKYGEALHYDFSIRQKILDSARNLKQVADNYHNRAYIDPELIIDGLIDEKHRLAATIQLEGGARLEGVGYIKQEQLKGYQIDTITGKKAGVIETKEKGGKVGDVFMSVASYDQLESYIKESGSFRIKKSRYLEDIRNSCQRAGVTLDGSHGFRWNFAQRRLFEYAKAGYTYEQSLQAVSWEMKHNRASITLHYAG